MSGIMYLGDQMVTPVILKGEENPLFPVRDGVLLRAVSNGVDGSGIKKIDEFGLYGAFYIRGIPTGDEGGCFIEGGMVFPDLECIEKYGMSKTFSGQAYIINAFFPNLKEIKKNGLDNCFNSGSISTSSYFTVNFDSLENLEEDSLYRAFYGRNLRYILFKSLKPENFTEDDDQFWCMLEGVRTDCTIYFPSSMEAAIGEWSDVITGYGKSGTTTIFWIPTKIVVNLEQENATLLTNDKIFDGEIFGVGETVTFAAYDEENNRVCLLAETGCVENGPTRTRNVNMLDFDYVKLTIRTSRAVDGPTIKWNNLGIPLAEEDENVYSVYLNNVVGETLVFEKEQTQTETGFHYEITTTGEDLDVTLTLPTYVTVDNPRLTENGTMGGDSFATTAVTDTANAWKMFDGDGATYWETTSTASNQYIYFYNPQAFWFKDLLMHNSNNYTTNHFMLEGSNDETEWNRIQFNTTIGSNFIMATRSDLGLYKYYRVMVSAQSSTKPLRVDSLVWTEGKYIDNGN